MHDANLFYRGVAEGSAAAGQGVARGLLEAFPDPDDLPLPDRLRELVDRLIEQDALSSPDVPPVASPSRLVLVLEDDPNTRDMAVALLEETVLDVVTCETGDDAVELLKEQGGNVAMVFTDVQLSGAMDGVDLAHAIEALWPSIRLVVTSGQTAARVDELSSTVVHLPKPWRALDVLVQVDRAVRCPALPVR